MASFISKWGWIIIVTLLVIASWLIPDPIPFIDEVGLPILDLYLIGKNIK